MKKIYKFIKNEKEYSSKLAKEIVDTFVTEANKDNIDYSFSISSKNGKIKDDGPNTFFVFDTKEQTDLHLFKTSLFDKDLEYIIEGSEEEKSLMEDVRNFLLSVCNIITSDYKNEIEKTIKRVVLGNKTNNIPLESIKVFAIDIADYSSVPGCAKYLLKIGKVPGSDINTDDIVVFIHNRQEKTGMDVETILSIEKKAGNPMFKNVDSVSLGKKFLNEVSISFFVDYSIKD